jgi:hypothetical protein
VEGEIGRSGGVLNRTGGVPNLGGDVPIELESAAARADTPGPATFEPAPASGVRLPDRPPSPPGGE